MRALAQELRERPADEAIQLKFSQPFLKRWWPLALLCALVLQLDGAGLSGPPLATFNDESGHPFLASLAPWLVGIVLAGIAISLLLLARSESYRKRQLALVARLQHAWVLFPRTARAARWFALVAITAGVCEEIAFRRLVPVYVARLGGEYTYAPFILSSIAFGVAHRYQGARGMVLTGVIGLVLYALVAATGSLWPAMCVHAIIDLRVAATYPVLGPVPIPEASQPGS
jgi:membrane protease YdiL (CAAX protease family)